MIDKYELDRLYASKFAITHKDGSRSYCVPGRLDPHTFRKTNPVQITTWRDNGRTIEEEEDLVTGTRAVTTTSKFYKPRTVVVGKYGRILAEYRTDDF